MIGKKLRHYVIEEKLGKGGMGEVYRARDSKLGRPVAIKVLLAEVVKDPDRRRRFMQEARAASAVNHPAIAQVYEIDEEGDVTYIVMEHVDGSTVRELVSRRELDISAALEVGIQVADALGRAHRAGIVHRDIKSDNIMVSRDGHPKILDFGLAKLSESIDSGVQGASMMETLARTQAGVILGTLAYMSPEQARGLPADRRSDIFSFGVVLYEMVAGRTPFEGANALDTLHNIASKRAEPITTIRTDLPYALQQVIDRCMAKNPEDRFQEMAEVVPALREVRKQLDSGVSSSRPVIERVRFWMDEMRSRGAVWPFSAGVATGGLVVYLFMGGAEVALGPILTLMFVGGIAWRFFRNRGQRAIRKFSRKAGGLREVKMISYNGNQFTVVVDRPTAKTYVKLNALLTASNEKLFTGEPMTMVVRDDVEPDELKSILTSPGVTYVREDDEASSRASRGRKVS